MYVPPDNWVDYRLALSVPYSISEAGKWWADIVPSLYTLNLLPNHANNLTVCGNGSILEQNGYGFAYWGHLAFEIHTLCAIMTHMSLECNPTYLSSQGRRCNSQKPASFFIETARHCNRKEVGLSLIYWWRPCYPNLSTPEYRCWAIQSIKVLIAMSLYLEVIRRQLQLMGSIEKILSPRWTYSMSSSFRVYQNHPLSRILAACSCVGSRPADGHWLENRRRRNVKNIDYSNVIKGSGVETKLRASPRQKIKVLRGGKNCNTLIALTTELERFVKEET